MKSDLEILALVGIALLAAVILMQTAIGPANVEIAVAPAMSAWHLPA